MDFCLFCSLMNPQQLEQDLGHSRCLIKMCCMINSSHYYYRKYYAAIGLTWLEQREKKETLLQMRKQVILPPSHRSGTGSLARISNPITFRPFVLPAF